MVGMIVVLVNICSNLTISLVYPKTKHLGVIVQHGGQVVKMHVRFWSGAELQFCGGTFWLFFPFFDLLRRSV